MQRIAWGWNAHKSDSLSVRPFEVMTGQTPRTITAAQIPLEESKEEDAVNMEDIRCSAAEFIRVAIAHGDQMRKERADFLNQRGRKLKDLKVGEWVKIYAPPGQAASIKHERMVKHMYQWRGPLQVMTIEGHSYGLETQFKRKQFSRRLVNIRRWRGALPTEPPEDTTRELDEEI